MVQGIRPTDAEELEIVGATNDTGHIRAGKSSAATFIRVKRKGAYSQLTLYGGKSWMSV